MHQPAIYCVRLQGTVDEGRIDYFDAQSVSVEVDAEGHAVTVLTTKPVDQAGLMGIINNVYVMRLPLVSVVCLSLEK